MAIDIFLVRGLPGSGKSTLAKSLGHTVISADDFFMENGEYKFDPAKLPRAHAWCLQKTTEAVGDWQSVVVANTFTERWELEPYLALAAKTPFTKVTVVDLFDGGCTDEELVERNVHGVPLTGIKAMRNRYEFDWKNGDTRPPWER